MNNEQLKVKGLQGVGASADGMSWAGFCVKICPVFAERGTVEWQVPGEGQGQPPPGNQTDGSGKGAIPELSGAMNNEK